MSWFSVTATVNPKERIDAYGLTTSILKEVAAAFPTEEVAHVKVTVLSEQAGAKMSLGGRLGPSGRAAGRPLLHRPRASHRERPG